MRSDFNEPLNLGQDRMITINELVDMVAAIAGKKVYKKHNLSAPQGVRGRNSDNTKLREVLKWEPQISLEEGLRRTYEWIYGQMAAHPEKYDVKPPAPKGISANGKGANGKKGAPEVSPEPQPHGDKLREEVPGNAKAKQKASKATA